MTKIISSLWVKFTVVALFCSFTVISLAQDKDPDLSYPVPPPASKISFQRIYLKPGAEVFPLISWNLKTPSTDLPESILSKRSNVPPLRNENARLSKKIGRAELFIGGVELVGITVLMLLPKEITKWSDDWAADAWRNVKRSITSLPVWDKDDWQLNYIGHPIAGSYYYNSLRSQNATVFQSFLFATAQSFIWEYIIEATAEKPSAQDLIVTPIVGTILGESTHLLTMNMRRNGFNFFEKAFVLIFNPLFVINNGFGPRFNPVKAF